MKLTSAGDQRDKRKADLERGRRLSVKLPPTQKKEIRDSCRKNNKNIATKAKPGGVEVGLAPPAK